MVRGGASAFVLVSLVACRSVPVSAEPTQEVSANFAIAAAGAVRPPASSSDRELAAAGATGGSGGATERGGPLGATVALPQRTGMAWVPPGVLRAGTPADRVPRLADEELPGTEVALGGFFVDVFPYPNEPGAIPLSNVTRDEAARLCEGKGKRLCSELEWERACKGPSNRTYEYGDSYRASLCGTGVAAELAAKRPSGERHGCKSEFGVRDMHGSVWEWTASAWERGDRENLVVLKGGNALAGEVAGRCANSLARSPSTRSPSMGFRCCAGEKNEARVRIHAGATPGLTAVALPDASAPWGPAEWKWRPVANDEIIFRAECTHQGPLGIDCVCRAFRAVEGQAPGRDIVHVATGKSVCGLLMPTKDPKDLRMTYVERTPIARTVRYAFGAVDVSGPH